MEYAWQRSAPNRQRPVQMTELASVFWQQLKWLLWSLHKEAEIKRLNCPFFAPGRSCCSRDLGAGRAEAAGVRGCWVSYISSSFALAFFLRLR